MMPIHTGSDLGRVLQHRSPVEEKTETRVDTIKTTFRLLWAEILHENPSDIADEDEFFEIGGDSISALKFITAAYQRGISITLEQMFLHSSLEAMAAESILGDHWAKSSKDYSVDTEYKSSEMENSLTQIQIQSNLNACGVSPQSVQDVFPCTPMQESLVAMPDTNANSYVRQMVYKLDSDFNFDQFQRAWKLTFRANPILRTRICRSDRAVGYFQAVIDEDISWSFVTGLGSFLKEDADNDMQLGGKFFRYAFVKDKHSQFFVWTVHHALCDGASIANLLHEVSIRFRGEIIPQRYPFQDFVNSIFLATESANERQFWQQHLRDFEIAQFPVALHDLKLHNKTHSIFQQTLRFPNNKHPNGLTKNLLLRAAWGILVSHHTGVEDVGFGSITNGRSSPLMSGLAETMGPTICLLPVALRVDPTQTVASFFRQVRKSAVESMPFEHTGISKIRKYLSEIGSMAANFGTMLIIQPAELDAQIEPYCSNLGLTYLDGLGKKENHSYPLVVTLTLSTATVVEIKMEYYESVLSFGHIKNLINQLQNILEQLACVAPDSLIGSISLLSQQDFAQIQKWNKTVPPVEEMCYQDLFKRQVYKEPNADAVCSMGQCLTYAELENCSTCLAENLIDVGVLPRSNVAVCFEKSIWTVVAILGVFKAGCAYLPIDPTQPRSRAAAVIKQAQLQVAVASKVGARALEGLLETIITIDNPPLSKMTKGHANLYERASPSDTAYILFTSGSTGDPKGIVISHSALCTSVLHHGPAFRADRSWRTLQFCAHTFDLSVAEFFTTLAFGGCVCIPSEDDRLDNLSGIITKLNVNTLLVVPTVANLVTPSATPTLKRIILAGEPITSETFTRWADYVNLTAAYGPSETTIYSAAERCVSRDSNPSNIGRAIGCTQWIVNSNDHNQLSAIGTVGELVISGALLADGYLGDRMLSEAAFVPKPSWLQQIQPNSPFKKIYKSGDLAKYNPDGTFQIVGRKDTQVKLRGNRIELGEIENKLMEHGSPAAVIATLPTSGPCKNHIVAVVSFAQSDLRSHQSSDIVLSQEDPYWLTSGTLKSLRHHALTVLPLYMAPTVWVVLDGMPLLVSGKVDRKKMKTWIDQMTVNTYQNLLNQNSDKNTQELPFEGPAETLRQIWSNILHVAATKICLESTYLSLGGDSISAIRVVSEAKHKKLAVSIRQLLGNATLIDIVKHSVKCTLNQDVQVDFNPRWIELRSFYEEAILSRIRKRPLAKIRDANPLSPIQRQIEKSREVNPMVFLLSWSMEITAKKDEMLSPSRLARAWRGVVQKHPIFRSIYFSDDNGNYPGLQVVLDDVEPEIVTSTYPASKTVPTLDEVLPSVDNCFLPHRASIYLHCDRLFAHIEFDHRVIDGWSLALIKKELLTQYAGTDEQQTQDKNTYRAFVATHSDDQVNTDRKHWLTILRDIHPSLLNLPPTYAVPDPPSSTQKTTLNFPSLSTHSLKAFSIRFNVTAASIICAAWAQTLGSYVGSTDVTFEYVVSGRDREFPGALEIIGPLLNVLPFHLNNIALNEDESSLAQVSRKIQEQRIQDSIYTSCNPREVLEQDLSSPIPFNTAVNFQRRPKKINSTNFSVEDRFEESADPWHFGVMIRVIHLEDDDTYFMALEFDELVFDHEKMVEVKDFFYARLMVATSL